MRTPRRLHRSARIPEGTSRIGTTAAYAAAIRPTLAASKPISSMNSFSTGTQNTRPCRNDARYRGRSRFCRGLVDRGLLSIAGSSGLDGIAETSELRRDPLHPGRPPSVAMSRTPGRVRRLRCAGAHRGAWSRGGTVKFMLLIWNNPANWDALTRAEQAALEGDASAEHAA